MFSSLVPEVFILWTDNFSAKFDSIFVKYRLNMFAISSLSLIGLPSSLNTSGNVFFFLLFLGI